MSFSKRPILTAPVTRPLRKDVCPCYKRWMRMPYRHAYLTARLTSPGGPYPHALTDLLVSAISAFRPNFRRRYDATHYVIAAIRRAVPAMVLITSSIAASAQSLPVKGAETTLDIGTWNIEHFGNDEVPPAGETQLANASEVIRHAGIDLWSVQEIEDAADFNELVNALGDGWAGELDVASSNLHVGFLYKTDVIDVRRISNILSQYSVAFAGRRPVQMEADVMLPDTTFTAVFIALHMKCCSDDASWQKREEASNRLKMHIDTSFPGDPVIVVGDFNDELVKSISPGRPSPYSNFVDDPGSYLFATQRLDEEGTNTYCDSTTCSSGSTIDHILFTNELRDAFMDGSADTYDEVLDPQNGIVSYTMTTSDHLPVFARFQFPLNTGRESLPNYVFRIESIFPNPVRNVVHINYSVSEVGLVTIRIVDILGRTLRTVEDRVVQGSHDVQLNDVHLPAGLYLLQVQAEKSALVEPFTVLR